MVKRKAYPCWINGPVARELVDDTPVTGMVDEPVREIVADSIAEERTPTASTNVDAANCLDEVVERGGEAAEIFWLLLELAGYTGW